METQSIACIDAALVDEVVLSAMSLLVGDASCEVVDTVLEGPDCVTVAVYCDDHQQSAVVLRCTQLLARLLTGGMLELAPDEIAEDDVIDATGELVNVIAGNLRGLVVSPGTMTAPFRLDETAYQSFHTGTGSTYRMKGGYMELIRV